jgi:hypothetical protein
MISGGIKSLKSPHIHWVCGLFFAQSDPQNLGRYHRFVGTFAGISSRP